MDPVIPEDEASMDRPDEEVTVDAETEEVDSDADTVDEEHSDAEEHSNEGRSEAKEADKSMAHTIHRITEIFYFYSKIVPL